MIYSGRLLPVALAWVWIRRAALPGRRALITAATALAVAVSWRSHSAATAASRGSSAISRCIGSLRAPARYVVLAQFALAILAAITIDDLLAIVEGRSEPPSGPLVAPVDSGGAESGDRGRVERPAAALVGSAGFCPHRRRRPGGRPRRPRDAAGVPGRAKDAVGARGARRRHRRGPRRLRHRVRPPRAAADHRRADRPDSVGAGESGRRLRGGARERAISLRSHRAPRLPPDDRLRRPLSGEPLSAGLGGDAPVLRNPLDLSPEGYRAQFADGVPRVRLVDDDRQPASGRRDARRRPSRACGRSRRGASPPDRGADRALPRRLVGDRQRAAVPTVRVDGDFLGCVVEPGTPADRVPLHAAKLRRSDRWCRRSEPCCWPASCSGGRRGPESGQPFRPTAHASLAASWCRKRPTSVTRPTVWPSRGRRAW